MTTWGNADPDISGCIAIAIGLPSGNQTRLAGKSKKRRCYLKNHLEMGVVQLPHLITGASGYKKSNHAERDNNADMSKHQHLFVGKI